MSMEFHAGALRLFLKGRRIDQKGLDRGATSNGLLRQTFERRKL